VHLKELILASDSLFTAPLTMQGSQSGGARFCYLPEPPRDPTPDGPSDPPRYRCQPDTALEGVTDQRQRARIRRRLEPSFTTLQYGQPGYAQLSAGCAIEIRTGAEDGSELGAFCSLKQPQREANLLTILEEYLPSGLKAGIFYVDGE
jgi:hypothetical protein